MNDAAIKVESVRKSFLLPHERHATLKQTVLNFHKKRYDSLEVLKDIDFDIKRGEFFGVVGRNGSGKSTLLKILAGIYQPTEGTVSIDGQLTPFIELGVGFNMDLTGKDNIYLNGTILGMTRDQIRKKYHEIVAFAELEKFMDQKLKNYSSGMLVRLAFSVAIQAHSDILLIDEVLAVGDASFQRKCYEVFKNIKRTGKTVVFVSHDMGAVQEYCDRAIMIEAGEIVAHGKPREVALRYEIANAASADAKGARSIGRPKDPDCKIQKIGVRTAKKATPHFTLKDDIIVDVDFEVTRDVQPLQFNMFLVGPDGKYVAGLNTTEALKKFQPSVGRHTLSCRLESGQLPKGDYTVNVAVYTLSAPPRLVDVMDASYGAEVPRISLLERSLTQNGEFYIRGDWTQKGRA